MEAARKTLADINRVGGHPALDFVNTVDSRFKENGQDYLRSLDDLVNWHVMAGLVPGTTARRVLAAARTRPREAQETFDYGVELRETLYRVFHAVAHGHAPVEADVEALNAVLASQRPQQQLQLDRHGVKWQWRFDASRPESIFGPVAEAAAELLTSDRLKRVKECPAPDGCGWLFLDMSRNRSRQWCSMSDCGNVAKVRRHRKKRR